MPRIPIATGFSIEFLSNGTPVARVTGIDEDKILETVEEWLDANPHSADAPTVAQWLGASYAKRDSRGAADRDFNQRESIDAHIEGIFKKIKLNPELKRIAVEFSRQERYRAAGLPASTEEK